MNTYRVDFSPEDLKRDKGARTRLMRDMKKVAKSAKGSARPRYLWKRRTDQSLGYWFQLDHDLAKDKEARELLKPYAIAPAAPPVLPESEWQPL